MEYTHLTTGHREQLRRERILTLEADHERVRLVLEEDPDEPNALAESVELRRRIEHHNRHFTPADGIASADGEPLGVVDAEDQP